MKKLYLLITSMVLYSVCNAQSSPLEDSLKNELSHSRNVADRMKWMYALSKFYLAIDNNRSEEYGAQIIDIADSSRDRELMTKAYLYNAERCLNFGSQKQYISRAIEYAIKALDIARSSNLEDYQAWAYTYLARGARISGQIEKAIQHNNLAVSLATNSKNDSLRVSVYNSLGNTYLTKDEKLLAFRNFLQALNIAEEKRNPELLQACYARLSAFYASLEEYEKAKDYEFKKEQSQRANNQRYELLDSYLSMGNLYARAKQYDQAKKYYERSIALADTLQFEVFKINGYMQIVNMYLLGNDYQKGLDYFNAHPEVKHFLVNSGQGYLLDYSYGAIYALTGALDSAGIYFAKAETEFESRAGLINRYYFCTNYANYHKLGKDYDRSITYYLKANQIADQLGSLDIQQNVANNLDSLYQLKGDYKNAHFYNSRYASLKDSLQKLSREKDLLSLEIDNENRRKEREALRQEQETIRRHNIQYMGITVAIAAIFVLLVMAGVFSVSRSTVRVLGFFAFIFLFEFIILLADNQIHHLTHGEPWKVLAIKIVLIAMLLPFHHWLEKKVINYLTTQRLLKVKGSGFLGKWFKKKDADLPFSNM